MKNTTAKHPLFDAYVEACNYPGKLDESAVEAALSVYLRALGIERKIVRLRQGWTLKENPSLASCVEWILFDFIKRIGYNPIGLDALAARDALDARDAHERRFAAWCVQGRGWYWYNWDLAWVATTSFGAAQRADLKVGAWADPLLCAFLDGCWLLFWTADVLYWVAKPIVHVDRGNGNRRLHNDSGPALESDVENLYFLNGVAVPAFVVVRPDWITVKHIRDEKNAEVRRVMIERMGWDKFCSEAKLKVIHTDTLTANFPALPVSETVHADMRAVTRYREGKEVAELLESEEFKDFDERPLKFVRVTDPSTGEKYTLRVWPDNQRAYEAVAQTFGMSEAEYKASVYAHS